jgi:hypothetical protein
VDRIKIIATLKWVHDILRELHFTDVLEDIDDCIMMLKKEQREAVQHQWVGLTATETNHIFAANVGYPERMCRAIEAKLKEKNNAV